MEDESIVDEDESIVDEDELWAYRHSTPGGRAERARQAIFDKTNDLYDATPFSTCMCVTLIERRIIIWPPSRWGMKKVTRNVVAGCVLHRYDPDINPDVPDPNA